jgi:hypothetical protein
MLPITGIETTFRNPFLITTHFKVRSCEFRTGKVKDFVAIQTRKY